MNPDDAQLEKIRFGATNLTQAVMGDDGELCVNLIEVDEDDVDDVDNYIFIQKFSGYISY